MEIIILSGWHCNRGCVFSKLIKLQRRFLKHLRVDSLEELKTTVHLSIAKMNISTSFNKTPTKLG